MSEKGIPMEYKVKIYLNYLHNIGAVNEPTYKNIQKKYGENLDNIPPIKIQWGINSEEVSHDKTREN